MWDKLRRQWPRLYEALEWVTFALAVIRDNGGICHGGRAVGIKNPRGLSAPGAVDRGSTMRTNVLYHGNVCLTRGNFKRNA